MGIFEAVLITFIVFAIYVLTILLLKTVEPEDIELVKAVRDRFGLRLEFLLAVLKRG